MTITKLTPEILDAARKNIESDSWAFSVNPLTGKPLSIAEADYDPAKHLKGRDGRWVDMPGVPQSFRIRKTYGGEYAAEGPGGSLVVRPTKGQAEVALKDIHAYEGTPGEGRHDPGTEVLKDWPTEPFTRDPALVQEARKRILSGAPTTRDLYTRNVDGHVVYSTEREQLHKQIIESLLGDAQPVTGRKPKLFCTGGGYASGKGAVVGDPADPMASSHAHPWMLKGAADIDPDKIKAQIPEFKALTAAGDPEANLRTYEEAWDIAQGAAAEARRRHVDTVLDGVGNTSMSELLGRVKAFTDAGYEQPNAVYAATPTDVAIHNAKMRLEKAERTGKTESERYIPDDLMRDTHAKVSAMFPDILRQWPGNLQLWNTNTWNDETKSFGTPTVILSKVDGKVTINDPKLYQQFLDKAKDVGK